MSEHEARRQPFKMDEMQTEPALKLATYGSARLDPRRDASQSLNTGAPETGRLLLQSDAAQARSLEGRPLSMYSSLVLADRSRLMLLDPRPRIAAAFGEQKRPMSGLNERRDQA